MLMDPKILQDIDGLSHLTALSSHHGHLIQAIPAPSDKISGRISPTSLLIIEYILFKPGV